MLNPLRYRKVFGKWKKGFVKALLTPVFESSWRRLPNAIKANDCDELSVAHEGCA